MLIKLDIASESDFWYLQWRILYKEHSPYAMARSSSLLGFFLEVGRDGLHDLVCLDLVIYLKSEEVSGGSQLELGDAVSLVLLDSDLFGTG